MAESINPEMCVKNIKHLILKKKFGEILKHSVSPLCGCGIILC